MKNPMKLLALRALQWRFEDKILNDPTKNLSPNRRRWHNENRSLMLAEMRAVVDELTEGLSLSEECELIDGLEERICAPAPVPQIIEDLLAVDAGD